jgi:hypothetical protein
MADIDPIRTYFWVVHYPKTINPVIGGKSSPSTAPAAGARPMAVVVYHRDINTTTSVTVELPRSGDTMNGQFYRTVGDLNSRIIISSFHTTPEAAAAWLSDEQWNKMKAEGASYAEMHCIVVSGLGISPAK